MRRLISLVLALGAVTIAAGCAGGGSVSQEDFQRDVVTARDDVDAALAHITDAPSGKEELLERMESSAAEIDATAEALEREEAPDEFQDEQDRLVKGMRQLAVDLSQTAAQIRQPGFEGLLEGTQGLSFQSWVDVNEALGDLREQGLDVDPLGRH